MPAPVSACWMQGGSALCADNLFTGSKRNVRELMENKRFEFLCHDVVNRLDMEVNQIYNLPCPASPCTIAFCGPAPAKRMRSGGAPAAGVLLEACEPGGIRSRRDEGKRAAERDGV